MEIHVLSIWSHVSRNAVFSSDKKQDAHAHLSTQVWISNDKLQGKPEEKMLQEIINGNLF